MKGLFDRKRGHGLSIPSVRGLRAWRATFALSALTAQVAAPAASATSATSSRSSAPEVREDSSTAIPFGRRHAQSINPRFGLHEPSDGNWMFGKEEATEGRCTGMGDSDGDGDGATSPSHGPCNSGVGGDSDLEQPLSGEESNDTRLPRTMSREETLHNASHRVATSDPQTSEGVTQRTVSRSPEENDLRCRGFCTDLEGEHHVEGREGQTFDVKQQKAGPAAAPFSSLARGFAANTTSGALATHIVRWRDFHPLDKHPELLERALGSYGCHCPCSEGESFEAVEVEEEGHGVGNGRIHNDPDNIPGTNASLNDANPGRFVSHGNDDDRRDKRSCDGCWEIVQRKNPATSGKFPSDFSVINLLPLRCTRYPVDCNPCSEKDVEAATKCPDEDGVCPHQGFNQDEEYADAELRGHMIDGAMEKKEWSLSNAAVSRAVEALKGSPWVKSVHRDQAITRGISEAQDFFALGSPKEHTYGLSSHGNTIDDIPAFSLKTTPTLQSKRSDGEGARRHVDGEPTELGGGQDGGLRGSAHGTKFVNAGKQGKPLHDQGFKGAGVRVAVFDTGLQAGGHDFDNVVEQINWTDEDTLEDNVGHGTHVAGVIGGRDPGCSGFVPDADLFVFRVFSSQQLSYTSWFLDAFNYAMFLGVDIINLSVGGPDFMDAPFVDKVREVSANGIVVVSAVGNDGQLYGTQHNPADQMDTIGVGAVSANGRRVADFQSRGMTTWELPGGYGRVKPDVIGVGQYVVGPKAGGDFGQCSGLSGTSVASPVVAGAVALLASTVPRNKRHDLVSPASIKQVLTESAHKLKDAGIFEQGAGRLDVMGAFQLLQDYTPRASFLPPELDFTDPYMWPFSRQPLYFGAQPVVFNVTVANGMGVTGHITSVVWTEQHSTDGQRGKVLDVEVEFPGSLWPWSGYLAVFLSVSESSRDFEGLVLGTLEVTVQSEPRGGETQIRETTAALPVTATVIRTPPRHRRLLWDQFHSVPYPPVYSPRDYLGDNTDMLDRLGDHPHTNFRTLFEALLDAGYYLEILGSDWSTFDADRYGALLIVDPEAEIDQHEKAKLELDVKEGGLSLVIFADWYSEDMMSQVKFVDDNTRMPWKPITGGANVPAINDFLLPAFGMSLGVTVMDGVFSLPGGEVHLASGNAVSAIPAGGLLVSVPLKGVAAGSGNSEDSPVVVHPDVPVIGAFDTNWLDEDNGKGGRVFLFGDSSCADDDALGRLKRAQGGGDGGRTDCLWVFKSAVRYACEGYEDPGVFGNAEVAV